MVESRIRRLFAELFLATMVLVLCLQVAGAPPMSADTESTTLFPPLVPHGEKIVTGNPAFVAGCLSQLGAQLAGKKLGIQLLSENDHWGTILRIDFEIPDYDAKPLINRLMCWRGSDGNLAVMLAVAQNIPPLEPQ